MAETATAPIIERKRSALSRDEKKIAGTCTYPGCGEDAEPDAGECTVHHAASKARAKKSMRAKRANWKRRKRCVTCGRKRQGQARHCSRCLMRRGELKSTGVNKGVDKSERRRDRTIVDKDGRTRYLGQKRRGAPSVGQTDEWDLNLARKELMLAEEGHAYFQSAEVQALPRIQRDDIRQAYLGRMFATARTLLLACKRGGWTIPGLNDDSEDADEIAATERKSRR